MNILGINCFSHDTSASLLRDGKIIAFAEEERFSRKKHTTDFPDSAIKYCLKEGEIDINQVDYVGFPYKPWVDWKRGFSDFIRSFPFTFPRFAGQSWFDLKLSRKISNFKKASSLSGEIIRTGHHEAHAASCFFTSPFQEAAILSIDRGGDYLSTLLAQGKDNQINVIKTIGNPHSVGSLYTVVTKYLGFKPNNGEGKVMGLAPYGRPTYLEQFRKLIRFEDDGDFKIDLSYFTYHKKGGYGVSKKFINTFGPPRKPDSNIKPRHEDIAWVLQKVTEEAGIHLANYLYQKTQCKNLTIAGGVGLNSVMNAEILQNTPFEELFIQPASNDAGTSLGAALYIWHVILRNPRKYLMETAFYGPHFADTEIKQTLSHNKKVYQRVENPAQKAAELIAQGKIVGWFQGRMEAGPRALGNRSILADPRDPKMKDILNRKVKHREGFRPFAPSALEEKAAEYFDFYYPSPFMLKVLPIKKAKQKVIPAVSHVDGTGRIQTLNKNQNLKYWELIDHFEKITGVPVVLNTSFNIRGEPIVCTPQDALNCFYKTQLDALIIGDYLLEK